MRCTGIGETRNAGSGSATARETTVGSNASQIEIDQGNNLPLSIGVGFDPIVI